MKFHRLVINFEISIFAFFYNSLMNIYVYPIHLVVSLFSIEIDGKTRIHWQKVMICIEHDGE